MAAMQEVYVKVMKDGLITYELRRGVIIPKYAIGTRVMYMRQDYSNNYAKIVGYSIVVTRMVEKGFETKVLYSIENLLGEIETIDEQLVED